MESAKFIDTTARDVTKVGDTGEYQATVTVVTDTLETLPGFSWGQEPKDEYDVEKGIARAVGTTCYSEAEVRYMVSEYGKHLGASCEIVELEHVVSPGTPNRTPGTWPLVRFTGPFSVIFEVFSDGRYDRSVRSAVRKAVDEKALS